MGGFLKFNVNETKSRFFDRPIRDRLDRVAYRGLARFGAFVRRTAKRLLKKARQKTLAELTPEERRRWRIKQALAKRQGWRPRKPLAPSKPGEPPRMIQGNIKRFLYFAYEAQERLVVIGPARTSPADGAPEVLEEGGVVRTPHGTVRIEARPYMKPAFDKELPSLPQMLRGDY